MMVGNTASHCWSAQVEQILACRAAASSCREAGADRNKTARAKPCVYVLTLQQKHACK